MSIDKLKIRIYVRNKFIYTTLIIYIAQIKIPNKPHISLNKIYRRKFSRYNNITNLRNIGKNTKQTVYISNEVIKGFTKENPRIQK